MNITLNNRPQFFEEENLTITEVLKLKKFSFKMLVIKVNGKLIKKNQYDIQEVAHGDNVQILHLISGG